MWRFVPLFVMLIVSGCGRATDESAVHEWDVLHNVRFAMESYANKHQGQLPSRWSEVAEHLDVDRLNATRLNGSSASPLQGAYVFMRGEVELPSRQKAEVILIRVRPVTEGARRVGRYAIVRQAGELVVVWLNEPDFLRMLDRSGFVIPKPDPAEVDAAKEAVRRLGQEEASRRLPRHEVWVMTCDQVKHTIIALFVTPANTNAPADSDRASTGARLRPIPVALAVCALAGLGVFVFRWIRRRRRC